ncbi:MAG TPA: helix-turn-helix transcriptional regulator [Edaphobacter sp.]|nr:helix-turn-helix transcriptional regulator [Edaphobacter sp.]
MGPPERRSSKAHWPELYDELRAKLVAAREEAGLTQREAANQLRRSQTYVAKSETGERRVDIIELMMFAAIYDKPITFFLPSRTGP